jgi:hypothetical protein
MFRPSIQPEVVQALPESLEALLGEWIGRRSRTQPPNSVDLRWLLRFHR